MNYKNETTATLLAFFLPMIGLYGISHLYVGALGRGLLLFFIGFLLYLFSIVTLVPAVLEGGGWILLAIIVNFSSLVFWIWQIFDARAICRQHNAVAAGGP